MGIEGKYSATSLLINSILSLFFAFMIIVGIDIISSYVAIVVSGFNGDFTFGFLTLNTYSESWTTKEVLCIYLFPWLSNLAFYVFLSLRFNFPLKINHRYKMLYAWLFSLLLIKVFAMPIIEIYHKAGIYFALKYLNFSINELIIFAVMLVLYLLYRMFRVSAIFAMIQYRFLPKSKRFSRFLLYVWIIPIVLFMCAAFFLISVSKQTYSI